MNPESVDEIFAETVGLDTEYSSQEKMDKSLEAKKLVKTTDGLGFETKMVTSKQKQQKEAEAGVVKRYTVLDILKNPALRANTFILWYTW